MNDFIHQEIPAELLRRYLQIITGDNSVLMSTGNNDFFASSVASCRYVFELTFKPIAACFIRPQKNNIRFFEKNEYFTLSYFSPEHRYMLDSFGTGPDGEKIKPVVSQMGNMFYPNAELIFECRKAVNLELILSKEIQVILATEKKLSLYPGNEPPRMYIGEIVNGWQKVLLSLSKSNAGKLLPKPERPKFLESAQRND